MTPETISTIILLGSFLVMILLRFPIAYAVGLSTLFCMMSMGQPLQTISQQMVKGVWSFSLMAVPFFITMGVLMGTGGISDKLIALANSLVGWMRGGLAMVNIVASYFFGGISGSASADTASLGSILIPMMVDEGYDADFSTAVTITSSCEGLLVPPSHNMVIYATTAGGISVGALFMAGYVPGAILALSLMVGSYIISVKKNYPKGEPFSIKNFFKQPNVGYPKFKKKSLQGSYTTYSNIKMHEKHITLPKLGKVKAKIHRSVPSDYVLKSATVSQTPSGKYYVSVLFEHESQVLKQNPRSFLGLDYSSPCLYIDSNGDEPDYPRFFRKSEEKLAREQKKLSHMVYRSNNYYKQKRRVARVHEKIANQRRDFLHKLSKSLADNYDVIGIEDLNMRGMSQSLTLGKSTMDNGWGMFTTFLAYKLERQGKQLIRIDKWFPSTKTCHECGCVKPMKLGKDTYICPECGMVFDRDWNAAINIRNEAMRIALL